MRLVKKHLNCLAISRDEYYRILQETCHVVQAYQPDLGA